MRLDVFIAAKMWIVVFYPGNKGDKFLRKGDYLHSSEDYDLLFVSVGHLDSDAVWGCKWKRKFRRNILFRLQGSRSREYVFPKCW